MADESTTLDRWAFRRAHSFAVSAALIALLFLVAWIGGDTVRERTVDAVGWVLAVLVLSYQLGPVAERLVRARFGLPQADPPPAAAVTTTTTTTLASEAK